MSHVSTDTDKDLLRLAIAQCSIEWENPRANIEQVESLLAETDADVLILPECVLSGFTMNREAVVRASAYPAVGELRELAIKYRIALMGSAFVYEADHFYNRGFLITHEGKTSFQDKRHLFRMAGEAKLFTSKSHRQIFSLYGWRILLSICYDIRFPVWCRNVHNEYDLLVNVANWPEPRIHAYKALLEARAIENLTYVAGVNRIGHDYSGMNYTGESLVIDYKGKKLVEAQANTPTLTVTSLSKAELHRFRQKFPAWKDQDLFSITY